MNWIDNILTLENCLKSLSARDESGNETDFDSAFTKWKDRTVWVRENRKTVYLIGNGASASMALLDRSDAFDPAMKNRLF